MSIKNSSFRPVRPVERQPMRDWILDLLDRQTFPGLLEWSDKKSGEFRIKWNHGSRQSWSEKDALVFIKWAEHTGRRDDKHDFKKMKANFRCALNSLKNVREAKEKPVCKGGPPFKVYVMKDLHGNGNRHRPNTRARKAHSREVKAEDSSPDMKYEDISEEDESTEDMSTDTEQVHTDDVRVPFHIKCDTTDEKKMVYLRHHMSGFTMKVLKKPEALSPTIPSFTVGCSGPQITAVHTSLDRLSPSLNFNLPETPESSDGSPHSELSSEEMVEVNVLEITLIGNEETEVEGQSGLFTVLSTSDQQLSWQQLSL